jgi:hypothetical protein
MARSVSRMPVTEMPMIRKGSRSSHTIGYTSNANRARGHDSTARISHRMNVMSGGELMDGRRQQFGRLVTADRPAGPPGAHGGKRVHSFHELALQSSSPDVHRTQVAQTAPTAPRVARHRQPGSGLPEQSEPPLQISDEPDNRRTAGCQAAARALHITASNSAARRPRSAHLPARTQAIMRERQARPSGRSSCRICSARWPPLRGDYRAPHPGRYVRVTLTVESGYGARVMRFTRVHRRSRCRPCGSRRPLDRPRRAGDAELSGVVDGSGRLKPL